MADESDKHKIHEIFIETEQKYEKQLEKDSKRVLLYYTFAITFFFECVVVSILLLTTEQHFRDILLQNLMRYYIPCKVFWILYHYTIDNKYHKFDEIERSILTGLDLIMILVGLVAFIGWIVFAALFDSEISYLLTFIFGFTVFVHCIPFVVIKLVMSLCYISNNDGKGQISETLFQSHLSHETKVFSSYNGKYNGRMEQLKVTVKIYSYKKQKVSYEQIKHELMEYFKVNGQYIVLHNIKKDLEIDYSKQTIQFSFMNPRIRLAYAIKTFQDRNYHRKEKALEMFEMTLGIYQDYYPEKYVKQQKQNIKENA